MHVCHLSDGSVGGDYFRNIAEGFDKAGIDLSLIGLRPGEAPEWVAGLGRVRFYSLGAASKAGYPRAVRRLARYLKQEKADILQTHLFYGGLVGTLARRFTPSTKMVLMRHHTSLVRMFGSRLHIAADRWMAERADHVIAVSEAARTYMLDVDHVRRDDIEVVYLGFDFERMAPNAEMRAAVRKEFGFADDDLVIGYVGNILPAKGHLELIEAFGKVLAHVPNAKLLFVGRGELPEVTRAIDRLPDGTVVNAGWRDDAVACYNAMDLFVQPSLSEAFSQVIIEAMGIGLPVIATDVGGAREVIESGVNGVLISPGDVSALTGNICKLCSDASERERIARQGRSTVTARFTASKMVEDHLELYRRWCAVR